jgi:hypothetical protein
MRKFWNQISAREKFKFTKTGENGGGSKGK